MAGLFISGWITVAR